MLRALRRIFGKSEATDPRQLFSAEVEAVLRSLKGVVAVTPVAGEFALEVTTTDGQTIRAFLENAYYESREMAPEQRRGYLGAFFRGVVDSQEEESWESAREMLTPLARALYVR